MCTERDEVGALRSLGCVKVAIPGEKSMGRELSSRELSP